MRFHRSRTKMPLAGQTQVPNSIWACNRHDQAFRGLVSLLLLIPSMRTIGSVVDGGRRRRCRVCRGRLWPSDVGRVAAQSCCTFGTLTLKCQRDGPTSDLLLAKYAQTVGHRRSPGIAVTARPSGSARGGPCCGQPWWSAITGLASSSRSQLELRPWLPSRRVTRSPRPPAP